jgi:hypothetical protein
MDTPRGYNPVGQSAPGLPHHDAPLPGHVPGQATPIGGAQDWAPRTGYFGPGIGAAGIWFARIFMVFAIYLTLPLQIALYPIAGAAGLLVGALIYLASGAMDLAWPVCFAVLLPVMRIETGVEDRYPSYRKARHWLRLALCFGAMYYFDTHEQMESAGTAVVIALITTAIAHFVLRARLTSGMWQMFQKMAWLRKA